MLFPLARVIRPAWLALPILSFAASLASAQLASDRGASIILFPRVIADGSADTIVQLANLSDNVVGARCAYVDASGSRWQATAFDVQLGAQRPLHWTAAAGRSETQPAVDVPPAPAGFRGELLCVQVDPTGAPFSGNELSGQASVHNLGSGEMIAYTAAGLQGSGLNDGDDVLCIGGEPSDSCFIGAEYDPCPGEWIVQIPAQGAPDAQLGAGSSLSSRLTVVPCSQDLRDGTPSTVSIDIDVFNELGQHFTAQAAVTCWGELALADLGRPFDRGTLGTDYAEARLRPGTDSGGFVVVAETTRDSDTIARSSAALVPHHRGGATASDRIIFPMGGTVP